MEVRRTKPVTSYLCPTGMQYDPGTLIAIVCFIFGAYSCGICHLHGQMHHCHSEQLLSVNTHCSHFRNYVHAMAFFVTCNTL